MAQPKAEFEAIEDFTSIANKLVDKYPDVLNGVDPKLLRCVGVVNKDPKEGKPLFELQAVRFPMRLDLQFDFYVVVNMQEWSIYDDAHKNALIFDILCCISPEGDSKIVPFDLRDHSIVIRSLGVDYMQRPDIPNILEENITWKSNVKEAENAKD